MADAELQRGGGGVGAMCYGNVDSKYMVRDIEARVRPLARQAEPTTVRQRGWLAGGVAAIVARIAGLMARPGRIAGPRT
jgi:hypothetical protein